MNTESRCISALQNVKRLTSKRLVLERFSEKHISDQYIAWLNDPKVREGLVSARMKKISRKDLEEYFQGLKPTDVQFAISIESEHIGNIKIYDYSAQHSRLEVGYMIGKTNLSGQGIATEALSTVIDFCRNELKIHKLTSGCFSTNRGSFRVLEKNGFQQEGVLKDHFCFDGTYVDFFRFGLLLEKQ